MTVQTLSVGKQAASLAKQITKSIVGPRLLNLRFLFGSHLAYRPGHFYSPICNAEDLSRHYQDPRAHPQAVDLPGIVLNESAQRHLWDQWRPFLAEMPFKATSQPGLRYRFDNRHFGPGDATVLYCMLRHFNPKRLIEIGSGYSSACALDTIDSNLSTGVQCTFIDPFPALLLSLLKPSDSRHVQLINKPVQETDLGMFDVLDENDILFIDSTHVAKTGSDVIFELFKILPRLKKGVVVHIHDIHYPFEYPREWVIERNYSWNEVYAVRAFLMYNNSFEVLFFNDQFGQLCGDLVARDAPAMSTNYGSGLWLRRLGHSSAGFRL
jgi:Methyltransferase domain